MRPLIGITTDVAVASYRAWEEESVLVPSDYVRAVERAGGRPLLVPPSADGIDETLDVVDGLIFSGGSDLDPATYGQEPHPETNGVIEARDLAELAMLEAETRLGRLLGGHAPVKSHHHQGFGRLGSGLQESAFAEDGTVEAVEDPSRRFALGVLWHPEAGEDLRLFEALVEEARRYREARRYQETRG